MKKEEFIKYCKEQGYNLTDDQFYGKEKIDRALYLRYLTEIPDGFNPVVSLGLYLSSLTEIPEWFNPVVGGNLWLDSLTSIPENWNPNGVRRSIYINDEVYDIKPIIKFINFEI